MFRLRYVVAIMIIVVMFVGGWSATARSDSLPNCTLKVSFVRSLHVETSGCPATDNIAVYILKQGTTPSLKKGMFVPSIPDAEYKATFPQSLYSQNASGVRGANGAVEAAIPGCQSYQVDVFEGPVLPVVDSSHLYGSRLHAHAFGGPISDCESPTSTTTATTTTTVPVTSTTVPTTTVVPTTQHTSILPKELPRTGPSRSSSLVMFASGIILIGFGLCVGSTQRKLKPVVAKSH